MNQNELRSGLAYGAVWVACGFATLRCIAAILDPTRLLIAYCIIGGGCATAAAAFIAAKRAYDDCRQRYNIAGVG